MALSPFVNGGFPLTRMRRMRHDEFSRRLMRETTLTPADLIYPMFVLEGAGRREAVASMPDVERLSIDLVVQEATTVGNAGSYGGGCAGFAGTTVYAGTLADLPLTASSYDTGRGGFAPASGGEYRVYRLGYTVNASAPSAVQGQTATATFTWESRS
jgi:hypothetical protein